MTLSSADLTGLAGAAIGAARAAGEMVARTRPSDVEHKAGGGSAASDVVTEVDRRSEALILERLQPTLDRFGLGVLSEEQRDDGSRHRADAFWCIDPLDGTLPFVEGRSGSAVSIALVSRAGEPMIGVAYDISTGALMHAVAGEGVHIDERPWSAPAPAERLSVFADRSFAASDPDGTVVGGLERIAHDRGLGGVQLRVGAGAVMNAWGVLGSPPACYLKMPARSGGGSLWDFAAMACMFAEAGASATDIHGRPLDLNRAESTFMHHRGVCFASDVELAAQIRSIAVDSA